MNRITRIREGFISLNIQVDNLYSVFLKFSADLVGEEMVGEPVKETNYEAGIFGAILNWQTNLSHRLERIHRQLEVMRNQITLQKVAQDKPEPQVHDILSEKLDLDVTSAREALVEKEAQSNA